MAKLQVSQRAKNIISSPIRKFLPFMQAAEDRGVEVFKLNVGDPDLVPPKAFFNVIKKYQARNLGYAPSPGIKTHVAAWQKYFENFKVELLAHNIIPTLGCAEALLLAMQAVCDPGDEMIVFEPLYASYKSFSVMTGVKFKPVLLPFEKNFAMPTLEEIEKQISKRTKMIAVINPDNPTGKIWSEKELDLVVKIAKKHNLFILSDETYREIRFDGKKPTSLLARTDAREYVIVCDSVSKRFSMPGARIGCVASFNQDIMASVLKFAQARLSAGTLEQLGLVPLLSNSTPYVTSVVKEYKKRQKVVAEGLAKIKGAKFKPSMGAFYQAVQLPIDDSENFVKFMISEFNHNGKTVMVTPMKDFYITPGRGTAEIRIAYVLNAKALTQAMDVLKRGVEEYNRK